MIVIHKEASKKMCSSKSKLEQERWNSIIPVINAKASPTNPKSKHMSSPAAILQEQRKMRIAPKSQRCTFITSNSEWGVPVHNDDLLFELLVLAGAQVGWDWSSVLRKRQDFRDAFSNFDAQTVSKFSEKKMISISADYCIQLSLVRGVVDNSKRILQVKKELGSLDKYVWGFVNYKAISRHYNWCNKTSKSEAISKDMVRRGFRQVGPTVIHSFMQAAGLTNE